MGEKSEKVWKKDILGPGSQEEELWCRSFEEALREVAEAGIPVLLDGEGVDLRLLSEVCMVKENGPCSCSYTADGEGVKLCFLREDSAYGAQAPPAVQESPAVEGVLKPAEEVRERRTAGWLYRLLYG